MFPKENRLARERDIKRVFEKGKRINNSLFSLLFLKNNQELTKATVVVNKKYDKRAVYRNRLKRKFREACHNLVLSLKEPSDIIILPKKESEEIEFQELAVQLEAAFQKIK